MKTRLHRFLVLLFALWAVGAAPEADAQPSASDFPAEIRLLSGAVLRKTSLIRWTADGVVVKHAGGADPVRFANIAEPDRSRLIAAKAGAPSVAAPIAAAAEAKTVRGQVFITTRGAGAYKFSGATVVAYAGEHYKSVVEKKAFRVPDTSKHIMGSAHVEAWEIALENVPVVAKAKSDADGKFELQIPAGRSVFLFCLASRLVAGKREINVWARPVGASESTADLDSQLAATYYVPSQ